MSLMMGEHDDIARSRGGHPPAARGQRPGLHGGGRPAMGQLDQQRQAQNGFWTAALSG